MSGVAASPTAVGSAGSETPASASAPKQLFESAYKYALVATRSRAPADGGALAICMLSTGGMAAVIGVGAGVPMNAAGWAEGAVLTLTRTKYANLVRDWVVLAGDVAGGTSGAGAQLPAAGGQRLLQMRRPPGAPPDADISYWDTQRPKLVCVVADAERAAREVEMSLEVYLGRLDPNFVATRWKTATAAGAHSGTAPLGSAPRAPQADARTVDMSGPDDAALRELVAILTPSSDRAAQEAIDRGRPLLSSAARAMAALSSEFRAFAMLVASQNALTDLQVQSALQGWRNSMLFAWANPATAHSPPPTRPLPTRPTPAAHPPGAPPARRPTRIPNARGEPLCCTGVPATRARPGGGPLGWPPLPIEERRWAALRPPRGPLGWPRAQAA